MVWKNPRAIYEFLDIGFDLKTLIRVAGAGMIGSATQLFDWFTSQTMAFQWSWGIGISILSLVAITKGYQAVQKDNLPLSLSIPVNPNKEFPPLQNKEDRFVFDMPFADAVQHRMSHSGPHVTYKSPYLAERIVSNDIYKMACNGEIRIAGELEGTGYPRKIPTKKLKQVNPYEMVTPTGTYWVLGRTDTPKGDVYWNLWVDSRDVYRIWPKKRKS